jgi:ubiquinol-cytochrome c reductase cytochrome b/c1 subunit
LSLFNYTSRPVNSRTNPILSTLSNHLLSYPTPSSLTYNWSYGSLAGLFFALQLITGIFLAMHYTPHVEWAFQSVEHIMTDVTGGYLFRYCHANGASAIFILIYAHMARGLYYQSYLTRPKLWATGVLIFLLMMATAFIGYVLPWGQMSFWGATVITSLVTAVPLVGEDIAYWVWGGFSVGNATLTRFFSLHFVLPFLILGIILFLHLLVLHTDGSTEPFVLPLAPSKVPFHPYYTLKDTFIFFFSLALFGLLVFYVPNLLGHSDNFLPANPLVTPAHIVPEWYFTPYYAILRACPHKIGGALGMFAAILILAFLSTIIKAVDNLVVSFAVFATAHKFAFAIFAANFLNLIYLGSSPAAAPYVLSSKASTGIYFGYFLIVLPLLAYLGTAVLAEVEKGEAKADSAELSSTPLSNTTPIYPAPVKTSTPL